MALPRMRWSNTGASLIGASVREGAELRSIDELEPELHIHLHEAPPLYSTPPEPSSGYLKPLVRKQKR